jgi:hypothetical protein
MKLNENCHVPTIDWAYYAVLVATMSDGELAYARRDAFRAARANPVTESLYMDEMSCYAGEQRRRAAKVAVTVEKYEIRRDSRSTRRGHGRYVTEARWAVKLDGHAVEGGHRRRSAAKRAAARYTPDVIHEGMALAAEANGPITPALRVAALVRRIEETPGLARPKRG